MNEYKKKKLTKRNVLIFIFVLIFLAGLCIFLYPIVNRFRINHNADKAVDEFERERNSFLDEAIPDINGNIPPVYKENEGYVKEGVLYGKANDTQPYLDELYAYMRKRNYELYFSNQSELKAPSDYKYPEIRLTDYGVYSDSIGTLEIEKLGLKLAIFLGSSDEKMAKGCGHLTKTSYPIGGENTNCVIAAHRGYDGADFLRYVEKLETGDVIYIKNFWYKMKYKVIKTQIIPINDVKSILIQPGKDLVTLYTCHPYGINNQRYLVFCERVNEYEE